MSKVITLTIIFLLFYMFGLGVGTIHTKKINKNLLDIEEVIEYNKEDPNLDYYFDRDNKGE